jgi:hypothetical protein
MVNVFRSYSFKNNLPSFPVLSQFRFDSAGANFRCNEKEKKKLNDKYYDCFNQIMLNVILY